jgi:hypothetical protein
MTFVGLKYKHDSVPSQMTADTVLPAQAYRTPQRDMER